MAETKKTKRPTAEKRIIQSEKRRLHNKMLKSRVKTATRSFESAVKAKKTEEAKGFLNALFSLMDKGVKKGVYKLNKARRFKSKLSHKISA